MPHQVVFAVVGLVASSALERGPRFSAGKASGIKIKNTCKHERNKCQLKNYQIDYRAKPLVIVFEDDKQKY